MDGQVIRGDDWRQETRTERLSELHHVGLIDFGISFHM